MNVEDFDFELPEKLIAQAPLAARDASRLLCMNRRTGARTHRTFADLPSQLRAGDVLVVNDAKVIPARLLGHKQGTGGRSELLLVRPAANEVGVDAALDEGNEAIEWVCLGQASKGLKEGQVLELEQGGTAEIRGSLGEGEYRVVLRPPSGVNLAAFLDRAGRLPLPPYIDRQPTSDDAQRYQTVYARARGSVAAPTAGLHFTEPLLAELAALGVERCSVTLDVGPGTFLPVRETDLERHRMHLERFTLPEATAQAVNRARREGRRVIAVGTTVVRTLEAATDPDTGGLRPGPGETALFIRPGYTFRQVDALVTNFHLPKSTLLMLVSAFAGREPVLAAYREAVELGYRFFSYGDAMFLFP